MKPHELQYVSCKSPLAQERAEPMSGHCTPIETGMLGRERKSR